MKENMFKKAKDDGKLMLRTVNLVASIARLKVDIGALKRQKEVRFKIIGVTTMDIYRRDRAFDGPGLYSELQSEITALQQLDLDLTNKQDAITQLRADFKNSGAPGPQP